MVRRKSNTRTSDYYTWTDGELAADIFGRTVQEGIPYERFFKWFKSLPDESVDRLAGVLEAWDAGYKPRGL